VRLLLDTHLLVWAVNEPERLSQTAESLITDLGNELVFSAMSVWEIVIKTALRRADFKVDASQLRRELLDLGYEELPITSAHGLAVAGLPPIHRDPFDRILIAQATAEGILLLTGDATIAKYPGPVRLV
jgi:PIN domain nuclease of toxin-antitoxin system